jgi:hypothetical protein
MANSTAHRINSFPVDDFNDLDETAPLPVLNEEDIEQRQSREDGNDFELRVLDQLTRMGFSLGNINKLMIAIEEQAEANAKKLDSLAAENRAILATLDRLTTEREAAPAGRWQKFYTTCRDFVGF